MLETFLAKFGYIAILLGTSIEGEAIMIMGGFSAHRGYLKLLPWVILAGFVDCNSYFVFRICLCAKLAKIVPPWAWV
jgi:membrane protein DedA with SNARE-associated domain